MKILPDINHCCYKWNEETCLFMLFMLVSILSLCRLDPSSLGPTLCVCPCSLSPFSFIPPKYFRPIHLDHFIYFEDMLCLWMASTTSCDKLWPFYTNPFCQSISTKSCRSHKSKFIQCICTIPPVLFYLRFPHVTAFLPVDPYWCLHFCPYTILLTIFFCICSTDVDD